MISSLPEHRSTHENARSTHNTCTIAFQGEPGGFGYEAARTYFQHTHPSLSAYYSFADVFQATSTIGVDYGVVPIENSQSGNITDVYDLLLEHNLFVIGEINSPINQHLLCLPGQQLTDIKRVVSHPQALAQSDVFLRKLGVETVSAYNTAGSAKKIQEEGLRGVAAVASIAAADLYSLEVLAENIQTVKENYTRFIVLSRQPVLRDEGPTKTMLALTLSNQPGVLYSCLGVLASHQINLLKLTSRPLQQRPWEYVFYLDIEGHHEDTKIHNALTELATYTTHYRMLGSFARKA
ncbi:MAG TPA: prephenate dehydratase [Ktedonobacteraceae bacterium]|nr:prephenate dehydratase [Ktedonobacteraceae bacterium]